MAQPTEVHTVAEHALDHLEEEIVSLEGARSWKRRLGWGAIVLLVIAGIALVVWSSMAPRSKAESYIPWAPLAIDVTAPPRVMLDGPPAHFAWDSIAGRYQYLFRVYVKGTSDPFLERVVTAPSLDLTAEEQARIPRGKSLVWTVVAQARDGSAMAAGQSTFDLR
jgi:hypothetical protein